MLCDDCKYERVEDGKRRCGMFKAIDIDDTMIECTGYVKKKTKSNIKEQVEQLWVIEIYENGKWHLGMRTYYTRKEARGMSKGDFYEGKQIRIRKFIRETN
jgi:hypothetical protein